MKFDAAIEIHLVVEAENKRTAEYLLKEGISDLTVEEHGVHITKGAYHILPNGPVSIISLTKRKSE